MKRTTWCLAAGLALATAACSDDPSSASDPDATNLDGGGAVDADGGDVSMPDATMDADTSAEDADTSRDDVDTIDTGDDDAGDVSVNDAGPDGDADTGPVDTTAPEFRDIRIALGEPANAEFDLNTGDHLEYLSEPVTISARIFARDDQAIADLTVRLVDADDTSVELADQTARFETGLWIVDATAVRGTDVAVLAVDAAGNEGVSAWRLELPGPAEAIARTWEHRTYVTGGGVTRTDPVVFSSDGTWCSADADGTIAGVWSVDGDALTTSTVVGASCASEADEGASYLARTAPFYVDRTYFSRRPLARTEPGEGLVGTWTATVVETDGDVVREVTTTLALADDGTFEERVRTLWRDILPPESNAVRTGTWDIEIDEHYEDSVGDFLVREVLSDPDPDAAPYELFELYVIRGGSLLIEPDLDP